MYAGGAWLAGKGGNEWIELIKLHYRLIVSWTVALLMGWEIEGDS